MDTLTIDIGDGRALAYREYGDPRGHPVVNCHGGLLCGLDVAPFDAAAREAADELVPARSGQELARRIPSARLELRAGEVHFLAYRHQADVLRDLVGKPEPSSPDA